MVPPTAAEPMTIEPTATGDEATPTAAAPAASSVPTIEPEVAAGRVTLLHPVPDLNHGRIYASYPEGGLTAAVDAMLKSIRRALTEIDYLKSNAAE